jgi:hypothetical protein
MLRSFFVIILLLPNDIGQPNDLGQPTPKIEPNHIKHLHRLVEEALVKMSLEHGKGFGWTLDYG